MDQNKDKWVNDSLRSLQGMERAPAPADLFEQIEQHLFGAKAKVIPIKRLKWAAAAAALLLIGNVYTLQQYAQTNDLGDTEIAAAEDQYDLLSSYKLYD